MHINSQPREMSSSHVKAVSVKTSSAIKLEETQVVDESKIDKIQVSEMKEVPLDEKNKEKLQKAVASINEFMEVQSKSSKFVFHEGLDKYYVRLVDSKTEEVIKEIPPERILDAFYEMQKLAGMIVDEKI